MAIRDDFFLSLLNSEKWDVGVPINRTNPLPLDASSVFKTKEELDNYAAGDLSYVGQPVAVVGVDETTLYVLDQNKVPQEVGKATLGDDKSISLDNTTGILKIVGFDSAEEGSQLVRTKDGVAWVKPDTSTSEGQAVAIAALQAAVGSAAAGDKPASGLIKDVSENAAAIKANTDAIAILNGAATVEGSVAYQIAQIVEENGEGIDTLKEIAAWIADHPESVAEINKDIKANADAIDALEKLVGSTAVATQIANAISAALTLDGNVKYALASELTALAGRVSTVEGKVTTIESKLTADPLHSHDNKTELDTIASGDVAKWNEAANKATEAINAIAAKPLHVHNNETVLNSITAEKTNAWNNAEANAKSHTESYAATKAQGALADSALQSITVLGTSISKDGKTAITVDEAKTALGLKSAAYAEATSFDAAGSAKAVQGDTTHTVKDAYELANGKATMADVNAAIAGAGHALAVDLTNHINNAGNAKHVSVDDITKWNTAATLVGQLTGDESGSLGSITDTIKAAIQEHESEADGKYATKTKVEEDIQKAKASVEASLAETDLEVAENTAAIATLEQKDEAFEARIAALEGAKEDYKAADDTLKSELQGELATKAGELTTAIATAKSEAIKDAKDYVNEVKAAILGEDISETFDTLKEIEDWINGAGVNATELASALAGEAKVREDADKEIDQRLDDLEQYDHSAYIAADATLKSELQGAINTAKSDLTAAIATAKTEAISAAATDAATKFNTLRDGAVKTNTDNIAEHTTAIAANTAAIQGLGTTKANVADVYAKTETYTKTEVENKIKAATEWGTF